MASKGTKSMEPDKQKLPSAPGSDPATASTCGSTNWNKVQIHFKNPNFRHSFKSASKNKKTWKNLKQIVSGDQSLKWPAGSICYHQIDAPPSFRPAKKYSDISGLETFYTDPHTKMNFASAEEFKVIKKLPSDLVAGYLTLRRANILLQ